MAIHLIGWQAAVLVPTLAAVVLVPVWRFLPTGGSPGSLDFAGALWVVGLATGLVLLVQSVKLGPVAAGAGVLLVVATAPLIRRQVRRRPQGFVPVAAIREPVVLRNSIAGSVIQGSWYGLIVAMPIVLAARGWEPVSIGLAMLPGALLGAISGRIIAYALHRLGGTRAMSVSALLCAFAMSLAAVGSATNVMPLLILAMALVYLAMTLGQPALGASVMAAVPPPSTGIAVGLSTFLFINGGSLGSAVAGPASVLTYAGSLEVLGMLALGSSLVLAWSASRDARRSEVDAAA